MTAQRVPVLMYHRVGPLGGRPERCYSVDPKRFSAHLEILAGNGYRACSAKEFTAWLQGRGELPEKSLLITFDDGYAEVLQYAVPALLRHGWTAIVFLVSGYIGGQDTWPRHTAQGHATYPLLDRDHIAAMQYRGFSLQSHSHNHADLTGLDRSDLEHELSGSKRALERVTGAPVELLAYPYGFHNDQVVEQAKNAGYVAAFSTRSGFNHPGDDPHRIRRLEVLGTDTPRQLLRKVALGTSDGSLRHLAGYFLRRAATRLARGAG